MISRSRKIGSLFVVILSGLFLIPRTGICQEEKKERHWAFRNIKKPEMPQVHDSSWVRTPIDAFVLANIEKNGLKPAPPADKRTLLRRVYLDLICFPPTPEEQK